MAQFELKDTGDLKRLIKDLRTASNGKELRQQFNKEVRAVLQPVAADVRVAYRAAPSMGHDSMARGSRNRASLRALLAKATVVQVRPTGKQAAVRVAVAGKRMPSGLRALPRYWEGEATRGGRSRWRHPIYGDRTTWIQQRPRKTFDPVVLPSVPRVVTAVHRAADTIAKRIVRGTI